MRKKNHLLVVVVVVVVLNTFEGHASSTAAT